tara:strand:- start:1020 stop:1976 length:957 start_codon:yes stop_codon:yes gene_type:complete
MAILRGGKRIGGFDIRIGLPRDRSLDDVQSDPRLRQKAGGNPETTMGRFQAMVNEAEGFQRKARFYVEFGVPRGVVDDGRTTMADEFQGFSTSVDTEVMRADTTKRRVQAFCREIAMPSREAIQKEIKHNGPTRKFVYNYTTPEITATFYTDKFMRERTFFEIWQKTAFSNTTHNINYYDNYVSPIDIYALGSFASRDERDDVTYAVRLFDCYPRLISEVTFNHDANEVQTFTVTFSFRNWVNYFIDRAGTIQLGESDFRQPTVKRAGGIFGGLISKLPPEIRRAGRDVLNELRRRAPIGRVTGGRVFPPFRIPPLNI